MTEQDMVVAVAGLQESTESHEPVDLESIRLVVACLKTGQTGKTGKTHDCRFFAFFSCGGRMFCSYCADSLSRVPQHLQAGKRRHLCGSAVVSTVETDPLENRI